MVNTHRRHWIKKALSCAVAGVSSSTLSTGNLLASPSPLWTKPIPGTNQNLPVVGMGTWITFDVPAQANLRAQRASVLQRFVERGGGMVDSSPMYGFAEEVLGDSISTLSASESLFNASKIWTPFAAHAKAQMTNTEQLWGVKPMDLMYVHNLRNWQAHLPKLRQWKDEGRIRYVGLSTSHGRRHAELEKLIRTEPIDFIQLTLNIDDTEAEDRLIPMAHDKGIAVVANRPFQRGALFSRYANGPLPGIAKELGCQNWAQYFLLYVVSHPGITCAIPATSQVAHMEENMGALHLTLPDISIRDAMRRALDA